MESLLFRQERRSEEHMGGQYFERYEKERLLSEERSVWFTEPVYLGRMWYMEGGGRRLVASSPATLMLWR